MNVHDQEPDKAEDETVRLFTRRPRRPRVYRFDLAAESVDSDRSLDTTSENTILEKGSFLTNAPSKYGPLPSLTDSDSRYFGKPSQEIYRSRQSHARTYFSQSQTDNSQLMPPASMTLKRLTRHTHTHTHSHDQSQQQQQQKQLQLQQQTPQQQLSQHYNTKMIAQMPFESHLVKPFKPLGPDSLPLRPIKFRQRDLLLKRQQYDDALLTYANENAQLADNESNNNKNRKGDAGAVGQLGFDDALNLFKSFDHYYYRDEDFRVRDDLNDSNENVSVSFGLDGSGIGFSGGGGRGRGGGFGSGARGGKVYVSSNNYRKICQFLEERIRRERRNARRVAAAAKRDDNNGEVEEEDDGGGGDDTDENDDADLHVQTLVPEIEPFENKRPLRQTLIEMAYYLKSELSEKTGTELRAKFNPVSKWQRMNGAQAELLIYEPPENLKRDAGPDDEQISPAHLVVLDCLLRNAVVLNLKGHFISEMPDLKSLKTTLIYVNLAFNMFNTVPEEVLDMEQIESINLRNNPIKYLPDRLCEMVNLRILNLSHCFLSELAPCVFELENLIHLDVSYNELSIIDEKIMRLKRMRTLNYEGNQVEYLPCRMLKMKRLEKINVRNNFLHPLMWANSKKFANQVPLSLLAMCAAKFERVFGEESRQFYKLSTEMQSYLKNNPTKCDCCTGKIFDGGLKLIRPCVKIFGVKYLPFLFHSCSIECYNTFRKTKMTI